MPVFLDCVICGKEFSVPPCRAKTAKACSNECATQVRAKSRQRRMVKICDECGREFDLPRSHDDRRRFCSNECRNRSLVYRRERSAAFSGAGNPYWKGGETLRTDGYLYRHTGVEHPFSNKQGYVLAHRKVMEDWLRENDPDSHYLVRFGGRLYLSPEYHVHHEDEDRLNNDPSNLRCMLPTEHLKLHNHKRRIQKRKA